jgi:AcrR family transcriptional regulator
MPASAERATHAVTPNRRGARSREAVLDAADRLIARHGCAAATVAALVEEAGVSPSSIYHHFGSKQGVVLGRLRQEMHVAFGLDPAGAVADRLARFTLAALAGAVIADGSDRAVAVRDVLEHLPAALVAARRDGVRGAAAQTWSTNRSACGVAPGTCA